MSKYDISCNLLGVYQEYSIINVLIIKHFVNSFISEVILYGFCSQVFLDSLF